MVERLMNQYHAVLSVNAIRAVKIRSVRDAKPRRLALMIILVRAKCGAYLFWIKIKVPFLGIRVLLTSGNAVQCVATVSLRSALHKARNYGSVVSSKVDE